MSLPPFQSVLDEHRAALHRYLVAALGPHDGSDCFQETMLAALRAYPSLRNGDNLGGWLFTIAHRKVIDAARAGGRRATPVAEVADAPDPRELHAAAECDGPIWNEVAALPEKQRSAVLLRVVADRPYAEVAVALACSEAAARQNVRAGLQRLRERVPEVTS